MARRRSAIKLRRDILHGALAIFAVATLIILGVIRYSPTYRNSASSVLSASTSDHPNANHHHHPTPTPTAAAIHHAVSGKLAIPPPSHIRTAPNGASALCNDGHFSSALPPQTCASHQGVAEWLISPPPTHTPSSTPLAAPTPTPTPTPNPTPAPSETPTPDPTPKLTP